jgi:hypothetical protein
LQSTNGLSKLAAAAASATTPVINPTGASQQAFVKPFSHLLL